MEVNDNAHFPQIFFRYPRICLHLEKYLFTNLIFNSYVYAVEPHEIAIVVDKTLLNISNSIWLHCVSMCVCVCQNKRGGLCVCSVAAMTKHMFF